MTEPDLASWQDTSVKTAILRFVESATTGPSAIPVEERIAVFDNDGTLWTERPLPAQVGFIVEQWSAMATADPALTAREPYRSAVRGDFSWLASALRKHLAGDDTDLHILIGAITRITEGMGVADYAASVAEFAARAEHPVLRRPYAETVYRPMLELLRYLERAGFTCYIVSGGDRDFMRPFTERVYGIPPERVIGSAVGLQYDDATTEVRYGPSFSFMDDGAEKPVRIWSRVGRRPIFAAGNSDGDAQMLDYALGGARPGFALLVHHDDTEREDPAYDTGAETVLASAADRGYTVASIARDWTDIWTDSTRTHTETRMK